MNVVGKQFIPVIVALGLFLTACGSSGNTVVGGSSEEREGDATAEDASSDGEATQNACPADGCQIGFADVEKDGDELKVTWDINFAPDMNNNHVHIYWDNFEPAQVSNDATNRNVAQGEWVPTDSAPTFVTSGVVSTAARGDSTSLCVVAGDRDHNVIDVATEVCRDVSDLL